MMTTRLNHLKKRLERLNKRLPAGDDTADDWLTEDQKKQFAIVMKMRLARNSSQSSEKDTEGQD